MHTHANIINRKNANITVNVTTAKTAIKRAKILSMVNNISGPLA
jgi:hypothetical protein